MSLTQTLLKGGTLLVHDDDDAVQSMHKTDLLITEDTISDIGQNLTAPPSCRIIECDDTIISPGFIDTHHHVWQTQLKGRHSDDSLLDYHPKGPSSFFVVSDADD